MQYREASQRINELRQRIEAIRDEIRTIRSSGGPQSIDDYTFSSSGGELTLSALFGDKDTLFVVHNMGRECAYCTLWADGFNGVCDHLSDRAAFVVSTPDDPVTQREFALSRGWRFPMVSIRDTTFAADMGYADAEHGVTPGVSVFKNADTGIVRVADTPFGPGDDFCGVWHLFDLVPEGPDGWTPKFAYSS